MAETWKQPFHLGIQAFRESKYEDAIKHFTRSIELDSTNVPVFDSRAAAYQRVSMFREALADTRKCISLQPERFVGYFRSARIFLSMLQYARALQMTDEARRRMNPSDPLYARKIKEMDEMETATREGLQAIEAYRRNHVDPLKKLPLELLVEICRIAVYTSDAEAAPRGASHFAVVLGSVCQSLRVLVHRTPVLWQSVTFTEKRLARKSAFWLERLDGSPLYSVTLVNIGRPIIPQLIAILTQTHPKSWKSLRLESEPFSAHSLYVALHNFHLRLYSISVVTPLETQSRPFFLGATLACIAPVPETQEQESCPRSILLSTDSIQINCAALPYITHLELTTLQLIPSQYNPMHQILHAAPRLRSLIVKPRLLSNEMPGYFIPEIPALEKEGSFTVEHLEVLRITTVQLHGTCTFFFSELRVLDLQSIRIDSVITMFNSLIEGYSRHICPPLREIRLNQVVIHPPSFRRILELFSPTLESLEVSNCGGLEHDFIECLSRPIPGTDHPLCCPRLRDINFNTSNELMAGPLVRIIKARLPSVNVNNPNPPTPIRHLVIDNCLGVDTEALPWMRANVTGVLSCVYKTKSEAKGRRRDRFL